MSPRTIFHLGVKELRGLVRDVVMIILIVYSFTLSIYSQSRAQPETLNHAAIAIVDEDQSPLSGRIATAFYPPYFNVPSIISQHEMDARMDAGLDTGAMIRKVSCPIASDETSASLYDKLAELGPQALVDTLNAMAAGDTAAEAQDDALANYAQKLSKEEARIDWSMDAVAIERCIRAFNPWPISWFEVAGQTVKVWQAEVVAQDHGQAAGTLLKADKQGIDIATGKGVLRLLTLQPPGKKAMSVTDLLNSRRDWFEPGTQLN